MKSTPTPKIHLYQRSNVWWFHFSHNGKLHRQTTGQEDKQKAQEAASRALREHLEAAEGFSVSSDPATAFERYISIKTADGLDPTTIANYRTYAANFAAFFPGATDLAAMTRFQMEAWKVWLGTQKVRVRNGYSSRTLSKKSVKERLVFVSAVCNEFGINNPCKGVALPKKTIIEKQEELKYFTRDQVRLFLDAAHNTCPIAFYWWSVFLFNTGARLGEMQGLRFKDVDFAAGTVFLISDKRDEGRRIKLAAADEITHNTPLAALMALYSLGFSHYGEADPNQTIYFQGVRWYYEWFIKCCKRAGVPVLSPHAARHTFVTAAIQSAPISAVAKFVGHKTIDITYATYGHLTTDSAMPSLGF